MYTPVGVTVRGKWECHGLLAEVQGSRVAFDPCLLISKWCRYQFWKNEASLGFLVTMKIAVLLRSGLD